jgi:uncharacterized membrane protein YfcA
MVYFPVSGVEVNPLLPLLVAFFVSALTAPAGVSGAFLLLPFQVSVLGFTSPAVSPTNLVYNILATPGGVYRYVREGRVVWPLAWAVILGTLPGVFVGAILRMTLLSDPDAFEVFVGLVLLYFGARLLYEVERPREGAGGAPTGGAGTVRITNATLLRVEYGYGGKTYAFGTPAVLALSLGVGVIGGIYSIGGGSIIAPFLVTVFGLPVYTVAGATLIGTFVTSVAGGDLLRVASGYRLRRGDAHRPRLAARPHAGGRWVGRDLRGGAVAEVRTRAANPRRAWDAGHDPGAALYPLAV